MASLSPEVLQDDMALRLAQVIAAANQRARELGVDVLQSLVSITQSVEQGSRWRVNYGPKDYIGRRGGDLLIEVDGEDLSIRQVLHGQ